MVCNVLTHYRRPLYEALQRKVDLDLVFYSDGGEWYWQQTEQPDLGELRNVRTLKGRWVGRTRLTPALVGLVLGTDADVVIKDPNGKFALPVTYVGARLRRKPFVFWASMWQHPAGLFHRLSRPMMRYLYRHADAIVTYGHHVSRFVVSEGADPARVLVSPQAVAARSAGDVQPARWLGTRRLLYVGRLEEWKGVDVLLRALSQVSATDWQLTVVGEGKELPALEALATELGIAARVTFAGKVPNAELHPLYLNSHAVVIPSIVTSYVAETWSLVVNEAMQAGCVVIASDAVGAVQDGLVDHGTTGYVFRGGDDAGLARLLDAFVQEAPEAVARVASQALSTIGGFTHEAAADAFVAAAAMAAARRGRR